jgi:type IV pilus assembly protein PilE
MKRHVRRESGFTLMEVMITVCIVAILAAIALPAYQDSITRGKLIDGTMKLGDYRSQMEKWFLDNRTYLDGGGGCGIPAPAPGPKDPFGLQCGPPGPTATTYTIKAVGRPAGGMSASFEFTVDQANQRTSSGDGASWSGNATCWAVRKDGTCQ